MRCVEHSSSKDIVTSGWLCVHCADFKDFASKYSAASSTSEKGPARSAESVVELMERIRQWLMESSTAVINIQTIDHHAYYRSAIDAPGLS